MAGNHSGLHPLQQRLASNSESLKSKTHRGIVLFRLKVARSAGEIDELRSAWAWLHSSKLTMFQSYLWNRLAADVFAGRQQPYFVFAESDNGTAIIPAIIDTDTKTLALAGERLFDYRDYLAVGDSEALKRAWQHLAALNLPISITAINRPDGLIWKSLPKTRFSGAPQLMNHEIAPEDFARNHARAFSRLRKLERMGFQLQQCPGGSPVVRRIYESRAYQRNGDELFRDSHRLEFMAAIAREMGSCCEVFTLERAGRLAAALVTFRDGNFRRFYTTYYDQDWARYSPGSSLLFEIARRTLEHGLSLDLMTGEQSYKMRIAPTAQPLFQVNASAGQLRQLFSESLCDIAA
jgi:CelD/BcsL family acetyltransferase involved in cellulose biosynthesis